jgi:1,4-dihydroxy-2-naphthoyl-CoA hydrolase
MPELTADRAVGVPASELETAMGIEVLDATPQRVVGSIPVAGNTQPFGVLHGGASCVLAETLASVGACLHFGQYDRIAVGAEINATHHAPARGGRVTGVATAVHLGRRLATYEIVLTDEDGRRVCTARMTAASVSTKEER